MLVGAQLKEVGVEVMRVIFPLLPTFYDSIDEAYTTKHALH